MPKLSHSADQFREIYSCKHTQSVYLKASVKHGSGQVFPKQEGELQERAAEGDGIHHCPQQASHDGCACLSLSAGYLDTVTARKISDEEPQHLVASPPTPSNQ